MKSEKCYKFVASEKRTRCEDYEKCAMREFYEYLISDEDFDLAKELSYAFFDRFKEVI